jgi:hypothetical protein
MERLVLNRNLQSWNQSASWNLKKLDQQWGFEQYDPPRQGL